MAAIQKNITMKKHDSAVNNYSNVVFAHFAKNESMCYERGHCHFMIYIFSGELAIKESGKEEIVISAGECVFIRRDHRLMFYKRPSGNEPYKGITMAFDRNFLRHYYQSLDQRTIPQNTVPAKKSVIKLPPIPNIESIFISMLPYFGTDVKPSDEVMKLKQQEGILTLLGINKSFYPTLFDFTEPWKIDILDFLNENYMFELSLEEIASYTGRSLATFKRDFKKISDLTPQRWIMQKRLEIAREKLRNEGKRIAEVYMEVGFKNRSHFATAYRKYYGYPPAMNINL
jgi:AraC-like DNA-binding protein